jgi:selenocysteine-specific elongation factor
MSVDSEIFNVVLGTAGHIDHGKSTLVQALTGIHPDRLKEEQDRGITIDLGFAPMQLSNGMRVGIIDVPGHEKFIKNMVAGASGIDFVMMVIAADDGVMEQTREHLQIVQLLGVRDGLVVITKKDLAEPEYVELVIEEVRNLVAGTVLDKKPILTVSSKTGDGLPELKKHLDAALSKLGRRPSEGPFRMPIQRVFAKEGFGTVVTGVPLSGEVSIGDTLEVLPPGYQGRVKGLHAYKAVITHGQAGHSTAINLHGPDIDKKEVVRGMVAVTPGIFKPGKIFTAHLEHLPSTKWPLKHRAPVRFHAGTAEIQGKVLLLDAEQLAPGKSGWIQILLEDPTVLAPGDRFILRHQSPMVTLGGGVIIDVLEQKRKRLEASTIAELDQRLKCIGKPDEFLLYVLDSAAKPKTVQELCQETGSVPQATLERLGKLVKAGKAVALKADALFVAPKLLEELLKIVVSCLYDFFKEHPALGSIERPELRRRVEMKIGKKLAEHVDELVNLLKQRNLVKAESNQVSLASRERKLEGALADQALKVEAAFQAGALAPAAPSEIEAQLKIAPKTLKEILKYLSETGKIVEATPEIYFHQSSYEKARTEVAALFSKNNELTTSEIRQHLGMNRKYVVPLVELFDRRKFTVRVGDKRRLVNA